MKPYLTLGNVTIQSYILVMAAAAATLALLLYYREVKAPQKSPAGLLRGYFVQFFVLGLVLALAGARLLFVVTRWDLFEGQPLWHALAFWRGGLIFYGGLAAVLAGWFFFCRTRNIPFVPLMDSVAPYAALAYAIGRVSCFLNGCCYGHETDLPWAMVYPVVDELSRHPTQLYSSLSMLAIFLALLGLQKNRRYPGFVSGWFLILYGVYRFGVEFLRVTEPVLASLTQAQLISLGLLAAGALVLGAGRRGAFAYTPL